MILPLLTTISSFESPLVADSGGAWHVHNPYLGQATATSTTLLGYALDGFPIYGPLSDVSALDECNGLTLNGSYQYHVRVSKNLIFR